MPCHANGMKTGCCPPAAGAPAATPSNASYITQTDSATPAPCGCLPPGLPATVSTIVTNTLPSGSSARFAGSISTPGVIPPILTA
jgi:hypothetical protein